MILNDILIELKRIANALEYANGITVIPPLDKVKASIPQLFDSNRKFNNPDEIFSDLSDEDKAKLEKELEEGRSAGFFFEEDVLPQELVERI